MNTKLPQRSRRERFALTPLITLSIAMINITAPAIADGGRFLKSPETESVTQTKVYTLAAGETVTSVAGKYHISPEALRQLNQLRTFAHGFDHLQPGDELDVPQMPQTKVTWENGKATTQAEKVSADSGKQAQKVAEMTSQAGAFLSTHPNADATKSMATSMAKGMATGKINQTAQDWMNRFGTAQVNVAVDEDFTLKNSSFNLLHPWYDTPENLIFSQTGIHRTDDRNQTNIGMGWRHFRPDDMAGTNLFLDYDLSRDHARAGVGAEYWRNFLKLSANGYLGLTGWQTSPDVEDYEERPASGWDLRAEGWLPAYPQFGANVVLEQYYGDDVGLFGRDERQKNPHALTAGISYTPFPMLTLKADERMGQSGVHDTEIKLELNYHPGELLSRQLDTGAVASARSLAGSRYDLAERNNNIVLEYRKQEVITLQVPGRMTGAAGQVMPLTLVVQAKHGLKDVQWNSAAFVSAGGKLAGAGTQWQLTLPHWTPGTANTWTISGVAHDMNDNASKPAALQIALTAPVVSEEPSVLTTLDTTLPADGISKTAVVMTLKDDAGNPLSGKAEQITLSGSLAPDEVNTVKNAATEPALGALKEMGEGTGIYMAPLTSGTVAGTYTLNAKVTGMPRQSATVRLAEMSMLTSNGVASAPTLSIAPYSMNIASTVTLHRAGPAGTEYAWYREYGPHSVSPGKTARFYPINDGYDTEDEDEESHIWVEWHTPATPELPEGKTGKTEKVRVPVHPLAAYSVISTDAVSYSVGSDMTVRVELNGAMPGKEGTRLRPIKHQSAILDKNVVVPNAVPKGAWLETAAGIYTRHYAATMTGTKLKAVLKWTVGDSSWRVFPPKSAEYTITAATLPTINDVRSDKTYFDKDAGFPTTGSDMKKFTLTLTSGNPADYIWKSDSEAVSVKEGIVTLNKRPVHRKVTITGTPKNGGKGEIIYTFELKTWFYFGPERDLDGAVGYCKKESRRLGVPLVLPTRQQILADKHLREPGGFGNEWVLPDDRGYALYFWTSDKVDAYSKSHYVFFGDVFGIASPENDDISTACVYKY